MRKIPLAPIVVFLSLLSLAIIMAGYITWLILPFLILGDFTGVVATLIGLFLFYGLLILFYRIFFKFRPLQEKEIKEDSPEEFTHFVYLLFYLLPFHPLIKSQLIPVTFMRLVYLILGATLGENSYCSGLMLDPFFTFVGNNTLLGQDCILTCHVIEGKKLSYAAIRIGNNVTVGAKAVIMAGVTIGDDALVGAGAVVTKGTTIGSKEVWGGIPAKKLFLRDDL